jgi:hypothetical protein
VNSRAICTSIIFGALCSIAGLTIPLPLDVSYHSILHLFLVWPAEIGVLASIPILLTDECCWYHEEDQQPLDDRSIPLLDGEEPSFRVGDEDEPVRKKWW